MRRIQHQILVFTTVITLLGAVVASTLLPARTDAASAPSLTISQLKITSSNGQFVTLYNTTDMALDMSKYQLEYFNSYDLSKATSSRLISLSGIVPPHGYFMINDSSLLLCYQLAVDSVSLGFSSTAGMVEVLASNQLSVGGSVEPSLQDYVGWSKTAANGAQTLPSSTSAFLNRQPVDAKYNPAVNVAGGGSWQTVQPDSTNACKLVTASGTAPGTAVPTGLSLLADGGEPPASFVTSLDDISDTTIAASSSIPASDVGLMAPKVNELLPNPSGTGNDNTEEFIELYNPNDTAFDLSGFKLQSGTTTSRSYTFPAGTSLTAKAFVAYYSADTGLGLSNSGSQVKLLDPLSTTISASEHYGNAKDGQAWALASGRWYWTSKPTPNGANIIVLTATTVSKAKSTASKKTSSAATKKIRTTKVKAAKAKKIKKTKASHLVAATPAADTTTPSPIHARTLVLVAGAAVLYGAYEYRTDLANRLYQFRSYLGYRFGRRR